MCLHFLARKTQSCGLMNEVSAFCADSAFSKELGTLEPGDFTAITEKTLGKCRISCATIEELVKISRGFPSK